MAGREQAIGKVAANKAGHARYEHVLHLHFEAGSLAAKIKSGNRKSEKAENGKIGLEL